MSLLLMMRKPRVAERYIHLGSEDVWTSLIFERLRLLPAEFLRRIVNQAVGREAILADELDEEWIEYRCWEKLEPPRERSPQGRSDDQFTPSFLSQKSRSPKEGNTEADVWVQLGNRARRNRFETLILIEMKLYSPPSSGTSYDPGRHQMLRNADVLWVMAEQMGSQRIFCLLWDMQYAADSMILKMTSPEFLRSKLPERGKSRLTFEEVARNVGWVNYRQVREVVAGLGPRQMSRAEKALAKDLLWLLDDLLQRSATQETLFELDRSMDQLS